MYSTQTLGDLGMYGNTMPKFSVSVNEALFCPRKINLNGKV